MNTFFALRRLKGCCSFSGPGVVARVGPGLFAAVLLAGCVSTERLESQVHGEIARKAEKSGGALTNTVEDAVRERFPAEVEPRTMDMGLGDALKIASKHSRSLQTKREDLYLGGITTLAERRNFGFQYSGTLGFIMQRSSDSDNDSDSGDATLGIERVIPTGGSISVAGALSGEKSDSSSTNSDVSTSGSVDIELTQPLLAGAGYEVSHGPLLQAENDLIYSLRTFALQRQDLAVATLGDYYELLRRMTVVKNTAKNVEQAVYLRKRSEALFKVRKATAMDVMRSQQQELTALNRLERVRADFDIAVKKFLVELGIPVENTLALTGSIPELTSVDLKMGDCIDAALALRLDMATVRDRVSDAERDLRIARNALLPDVQAVASAGVDASGEDGFPSDDSETTASAGIEMQIPIDRRNERDSVARAMINLKRARRNVEEKQDTIKVEIMESFRLLKAQEESVKIEYRNRELAEKRAAYAVLQFKNGDFSNRDVVEAQNELLDAGNSYVDALVSYEIRRIKLLKDIGILDVGPDGALIELPVPR